VDALVKQVKNLGGVDPKGPLLRALGGEAAFAVEPSPGGAGQANNGALPPAGSLPGSKTPFLLFVGTGIDQKPAGRALAGLEKPLANALNSKNGAQGFSTHKIAGVSAHSLHLSSTVDLTYAIVESALVVATDPAGVKQIASGKDRLGDAEAYQAATGELPESVSALGYLNLQGLVSLAEGAGLAQNPAYATFAPEIRRLEALGLGVQSSSSQLATDLRLVVGQGPLTAAGAGAAGVPPPG
jgi:hypothetical protein